MFVCGGGLPWTICVCLPIGFLAANAENFSQRTQIFCVAGAAKDRWKQHFWKLSQTCYKEFNSTGNFKWNSPNPIWQLKGRTGWIYSVKTNKFHFLTVRNEFRIKVTIALVAGQFGKVSNLYNHFFSFIQPVWVFVYICKASFMRYFGIKKFNCWGRSLLNDSPVEWKFLLMPDLVEQESVEYPQQLTGAGTGLSRWAEKQSEDSATIFSVWRRVAEELKDFSCQTQFFVRGGCSLDLLVLFCQEKSTKSDAVH